MTPESAEALELSILKWKKNAQVLEISDAKIYSGSCPLCRLFLRKEDEEGEPCYGCPVREHTGKPECEGSPWERAQDMTMSVNLKDFHVAAEAEVAFLSSLREEPGSE